MTSLKNGLVLVWTGNMDMGRVLKHPPEAPTYWRADSVNGLPGYPPIVLIRQPAQFPCHLLPVAATNTHVLLSRGESGTAFCGFLVRRCEFEWEY